MLSETQLQSFARNHPQWQVREKHLHRTFEFSTFPKAIDFVNAVAQMAEAHSHHPDIDIRYRVVTLSLTTHDENGLTAKDIALAEAIDSWLGA